MWHVNDLTSVQQGLLSKRIIDLSGEVDGDMGKYVHIALTALTAEGSPEVEVRITSRGGSTIVGLDIYDLLRSYKGKTVGKVYAFAHSTAAVLLQGCAQRLCARHANILIHHPRTGKISLDFLKDQKKMSDLLIAIEKEKYKQYKILTERTKQGLEKISEMCERERELSAEEAKVFGLVDDIF